jgi:integrase
MRVGELERLTWADVDEPRGRWRVSAGASKTGRARWVQAPVELFAAVTRLVAREDRTPDRRVFQGFGADRFRTTLTRACTAAGVPTFSPTTCATAAFRCSTLPACRGRGSASTSGQRSLRVTADTYSHVLVDERELDYAAMIT